MLYFFFSQNESRLFLHLIMYCNYFYSMFLQVLQLFVDSHPAGEMLHVFLSAVHNSSIRKILCKEMIYFDILAMK